MDLYMGETYATGEPEIATDAEAWKGWFNGLSNADKMAWASAYTGAPVTTKAAALGIARNYAIAGGAEVRAHMVSSASVAMVSQFAQQRQTRQLLLWGGVAVAAYFVFFGRRRRRA